MILQYILLVLGIAALAGAVVLLFKPRWPAAPVAFVGLLLLHWSYFIAVPTDTFIFWGTAALMVAGLAYLQPAGEPDGRGDGNLYIGVSALAGCMLGMILGARVMVLGTVLGALVGEFAYSRTPAGRGIRQPAAVFLRYFGAKGLPAIVTVAIIGLAVEGFIL